MLLCFKFAARGNMCFPARHCCYIKVQKQYVYFPCGRAIIFDVISDMIFDVISDVIFDVIFGVRLVGMSISGKTENLRGFYEKILHNFGITIHNTCDDSVRNGIGRNYKNGISQDSYPS